MMFVTNFYLFVSVCLIWTWCVGPILEQLRKRIPAFERLEANLGLAKLYDAAQNLDMQLGRVPLLIPLAVLALSLFAEVSAMRHVAEFLPGDRVIERHWPVSFILQTHYFAHYQLFGRMRLIVGLLSGLEAIALRSLWQRFTAKAPQRYEYVAMAITAVLMFGFAIFSRTMEQPDLYAYVIIAKLGFSAYAPPAIDGFGGDFHILDAVAKIAWGDQNYPYGPAFIAFAHATFGQMPHLFGAIVLARTLAAAAVAILAWTVARLGLGTAGALLVALNPAIIHEYIVEGHNDIFPMTLVAVAFLAVRRQPLLAFIAVVAAGMLKIPYALLGTLAFVSIVEPPRRIGLAAGSVLTTIALSAALGGRPYLDSMRYHAGTNSVHQGLSVLLVRYGILAVAALAIAAAVLFVRVRATAAYTMPQFAMAAYPWYVGMGLPYALLAGAALPTFLIALPVTIMMNDFWFGGRISLLFGLAGAAIVALRGRGASVIEKPEPA